MRKKIFKTAKYLFLTIIGLFIILAVWNFICRRADRKQVDGAYGTEVDIGGRKMVVEITGKEGAPTIVLLPGWGCASPVLEFRPLAERLGKDYRVITVEPFGYGLSDGTDKARRAENIVEELHDCMEQLGCGEYYLMGHSIAGLYSLYWANQYPEAVQGFIGIDPSVPKMEDEEPFPVSMVTINKLSAYLGKAMNATGITRLKSVGNPKNAVYADAQYPYSDKELETFRILTIDASYNKTVMGELDQMENNLETVRNLKFPKTVPVLAFLSEDNCKMMPAWEQLHKDTIAKDGNGELLKMSGGHYLHFEHPAEIVEKVNKWLRGN